MLIRIKNKLSGIIDYLVNGTVNQGAHRDEYDERLIISGDMAQAAAEIKWAQANTSWSTTYKHFTAGFSPDEARRILALSSAELTKALKAITIDIIAHHFPHRDPSELIHHCEVHIPRISHLINNDGKARLPHIHIVVPLRDPRTDTKLVCIPKNDAYMSAIQSEICAKYKNLLIDPVVAMLRNQENQIERSTFLTKTGNARKDLIAYLDHIKPKSGAELQHALLTYGELDTASKISIRATGSESKGGRHVSVRIKGVKSVINIRGKDFPFAEILFDQYRTASSDKAEQKEYFERFKNNFLNDDGKSQSIIAKISKIFVKKLTVHDSIDRDSYSREEIYNNAEVRKRLIETNRQKFFGKKHNKPISQKIRDKRSASYKKTLVDIKETIESLNKAQRTFYILYGSNIDKKYVEDGAFYRPRENPSVIVYTSPKLKCKIIDHGDKLSASTTRDTNQKKLAQLMIEQGIAKGWDIAAIRAHGSEEWKWLVREEIANRIKEECHEKIDLITVAELNPKNIVPAHTRRAHEFERRIKGFANQAAKNKCEKIKALIDQDGVIKLAIKYGVEPDLLIFSRRGQYLMINIMENGPSYNAIDFFYKGVGLPISEVISQLEKTLIEQDAEKKDQILTNQYQKTDFSHKSHDGNPTADHNVKSEVPSSIPQKQKNRL